MLVKVTVGGKDAYMSRERYERTLDAIMFSTPDKKRAEQMLAQNSCSIEYICEQLNFCSPAYFRRVFKQHTKMLPSQIKNRTSTI